MENLFRDEAIEHHSKRLYGEVILATSLRSKVMTALILTIVAIGIATLSFGSLARKETVTGEIVTSLGLSKTFAPSGALVTAVHVKEGQTVSKGDPLFTYTTVTTLENGTQKHALLLEQLDSKEQVVLRKKEALKHQFEDERALLTLEQQELAERRIQILGLQELALKRAELAQESLGQARPLLENGLITSLELLEREQNSLESESETQKLKMQLTETDRAIDRIGIQITRSQALEAVTLADLNRDLAAVRLNKIEVAAGSTVLATAAVPGKVVSLRVRSGQRATGNALLVSILPIGGELIAELQVPSNAVGLISNDEPVRLLFDSFPYQKFGTTKGIIKDITGMTLRRNDVADGSIQDRPVYIARVALESEKIDSLHGSFDIRPGMTLTADIILEDRQIWELVFGPLLRALRRNTHT